MEIDYQKGDLVMWLNKPAIIIYAHPSDPMVQVACEDRKVWAIKNIIKPVEA